MQFNEHQLELYIMELFENEGYTHQTGNDIHREKIDVLLGTNFLYGYVSKQIK